jgi:hypothetical protein
MKTITLTLAAGQLVLGPLLAATIRDNKDAIKQAQAQTLAPFEMMDLTCTLAHACAKRVDPAITLDHVAELVDMENFGDVFAACWGVSVPETTPGETPQAANPST